MNADPCSMALLVEAKRDGRLGDRELGSVQRHLATCASCAALDASLDHVRVLLRVPALEPLPLEVQRRRLKLLREAAFPPPSARPRPRFVGLALSFAALTALVIAGVLQRSRASHAVAAQAPSAVASAPVLRVTTVTPEGQARFGRTSQSGTEIVTLSDGAVSLSVRHLEPGERFLVKTGDAEVEVRGTLFRVEAAADRIHNVSVVEGKVEVRFRGATYTLTADERWDRPVDAPIASPPSPSLPTATRALHPPVVPREAVSATPAAGEDGAAFVDGMGMMERGDYGAAARRLDGFSRSNPKDDRAEDAAFLVIVAYQRAGRPAEAAAAARHYLSAYPGGYRRDQARVIADAP